MVYYKQDHLHLRALSKNSYVLMMSHEIPELVYEPNLV